MLVGTNRVCFHLTVTSSRAGLSHVPVSCSLSRGCFGQAAAAAEQLRASPSSQIHPLCKHSLQTAHAAVFPQSAER